MKKLSVKNLVDFRKRSDRGKRTFVENIKANKATTPTVGGGDYWTISLSAICNAFNLDDKKVIKKKILEVQNKLSNCKHSPSRIMYQRNISILQNYLEIDINKLRPVEKLTFLKKSTGIKLLNIKGILIEVDVKRSHAFTFTIKDKQCVGAIWFIAQVDGYRSDEVGMFCEMLYKFLNHNYSSEYRLAPEYCVAVEVTTGRIVNYSEIKNGLVSQRLNSTLDEINKFL